MVLSKVESAFSGVERLAHPSLSSIGSWVQSAPGWWEAHAASVDRPPRLPGFKSWLYHFLVCAGCLTVLHVVFLSVKDKGCFEVSAFI